MDKELLETPDDEIKNLPIRDMLRLVAYRESLEVRITLCSCMRCLDPKLSLMSISC